MARPRKNGKVNGKALATPQSVNMAVKGICDIMRRSNCAGALQYVPELTWILFLRILDERETREAEEAEAVGAADRRKALEVRRWRAGKQGLGLPGCWSRPIIQGPCGGRARKVGRNDEKRTKQ
jgi:hypothetical protein